MIKVNSKQSQKLKKSLKQFNDLYSTEQSQFSTSSDTEYYIVSAKYIKQWIQFCTTEDNERSEPAPMNEDLMDAGGQMKKNLAQGQDFEIFNQKIYDIIKSGKGFELKRHAVFVGNQKKVPIYLDHIKYIKISYKDVYNIDYKKISAADLKLKQLQISHQETIENMNKRIKQAEQIGARHKARSWKNSFKQLNNQSLHKYIQEKTAKISNYRFEGLGKLIEKEDATIEDLNMQPDDYFIVEVADEYSSYFFTSQDEAKCQGCYKYKKLPFVCGCKVVAYCTTQCQQKDLKFHIRDCKYAQQRQLNEEIEMNINSSSAMGRVGLSNLGNTCFMNSCLQCLSNTKLLTDYFLKKCFDKQINKDNPLGSKGRLARNYAKFIKNMWCESNSTFSPHNLKGAVAKLNPIFSGYAQHDSQQFFSFLADGIHEDLNRVLKKPYVESVQSKGRSDEIVAKQSWLAYTQRNQSIIVDLLTGQYKSKVICPQCNLQSITFDPFTTVSLPIPQQPTVSQLKYYVIYNDNEKEAIRTSFQYTVANTKQWLQTATKTLNRSPDDFVFYVLTLLENIYPFQTTSKAQIIHKTQVQGKNIFLLQLSQEQKNMKERVELTTRFCKKSYYGDYDNLWFKRPFFFEKSTTKAMKIYCRVLKYLFQAVEDKKNFKSYDEYQQKMLNSKPFTLVLKWKKTLERYYGKIQVKFDQEIVIQNLDASLQEILQNKNVKDCELDVRFSKDTAKLFEFQRLKKCTEVEDKNSKKYSYKQNSKSSVSLDECFKFFEEKEQLQHGNEWYCPRCKDHKLATKQMTIYKAPEILILHLKRFKNKGTFRKQKNETNVKFPLVLNMSSYVIDPLPMSSYIDYMKKQEKYLEPSYKAEYDYKAKPEYELYAISNHYGGLGGGHYTAYGKNGNKWYEFNDSSVHSASQEDLKGSGAYMLFYRRIGSMQIK